MYQESNITKDDPERSIVLELTILSGNILLCRNGQRALYAFMTYLHFKNTAKEISNQSYTHSQFKNFTFEICLKSNYSEVVKALFAFPFILLSWNIVQVAL